MGALTLALIAAGVVYTQAEWPEKIPLQVRHALLTGTDQGGLMKAKRRDRPGSTPVAVSWR